MPSRNSSTTEDLNGLLLVDKPVGPTSMDVVRAARKALDTRKIGHTGTLDPLATGLMAVTVGRCTKLAKFLALEPKQYTFEIVFGEERTTDDPAGDLTATGRTDVAREEVVAVLPEFIGELEQVPPRYSAVKVDGVRAYDLARAGADFELEPRRIQVDSLELLSVRDEVASMCVTCGSGTYVRSIARDLARRLGTVAHARAIRRTRVGAWTLDHAVELEELNEHPDARDVVLGVPTMLAELPVRTIDEAEAHRILHGHSLALREERAIGDYVTLVRDGQVVAVAEVRDKRGLWLQPRRVLLRRPNE